MEMMLQYQQIALTLAQKYDPVVADQLATMVLQQNGQPIPMGNQGSEEIDLDATNEPKHIENARNQARSSTQAD